MWPCRSAAAAQLQPHGSSCGQPQAAAAAARSRLGASSLQPALGASSRSRRAEGAGVTAAAAAASAGDCEQQPFPCSSGAHSSLLQQAHQRQVAEVMQCVSEGAAASSQRQTLLHATQHASQPAGSSSRRVEELCWMHTNAANSSSCWQPGPETPQPSQQQQQADLLLQHARQVPTKPPQSHQQPQLPAALVPAGPRGPGQKQDGGSQLVPSPADKGQQQEGGAPARRGRQRPSLQLASQHPSRLTSWIGACQSLAALQEVGQLQPAALNPIHLSAMLVQLTKVAAGPQRLQAAAAATATTAAGGGQAGLQQFALQLAQQLVERLHECSNARQAANAAWALASLRCRPPASLLAQLGQQLAGPQQQLLAASSPQELANLAWGLAKLQHDAACGVWHALLAAVQPQLAGLKPKELAMLLWAVAGVQEQWQAQQQQRRPRQRRQQQQHQQQRQRPHQPAGAGLQAVATPAGWDDGGHRHAGGGVVRRMGVSAGQLNPKPKSWVGQQALTGAGRVSSSSSEPASIRRDHQQAQQQQLLEQFLPAASRVLVQQLGAGQQQYKCQEVSMLLWSCAVLGFRDTALLQALTSNLMAQLAAGRCNSQDVANSIWALSKLRALQPQLVAAVSAAADSWLARSSCQELGLVLHGTAAAAWQERLRSRRSGDASGDTSKRPHALALWHDTAAAACARLSGARVLRVAEAATFVQAAAEVLRSPRQHARRPRQQQPPPQQQAAADAPGAGSSDCRGVDTAVAVAAPSPFYVGLSSMTGSWDSGDDTAAAATAQARTLLAAVDACLCRQAAAAAAAAGTGSGQQQQQQQVSAKHVAPMLHAFAIALPAYRPSPAMLQLLLSSATAAAASMSCQELAMTAWAAAKLGAGSSSSSGDAMGQLMDAVDDAAAPQLHAMLPLQLSMLAWAHGKLWRLGDSLFMHQLGQAAVAGLHAFGPQALANLAWGFAQLHHYDGTLTAALGRRARVLLPFFSPAELSNVALGLVTLRLRHTGLLRGIAAHAAEACDSWDAKACVKLATAFTSRGMPGQRYRSLLSALAASLVAKPPAAWAALTPHELVQLAVAYAAARVRHRPLVRTLAVAAAERLSSFALVDAVALVWAMAALNQQHDELLAAVSRRVAAALPPPPQQQQPGSSAEPHQQLAGGDSLHSSEQCDTPSSSSSYDSPLQGVPIDAVVGSKLRSQQLARLAWAYRSFNHPDAGWYLEAARLAAWPDDGGGGGDGLSSHGGSSSMGDSSSSSEAAAPRLGTFASLAHPGHSAIGSSSSNGFGSSSSSSNGAHSSAAHPSSANGSWVPGRAASSSTPVRASSSTPVRVGSSMMQLQRPVFHPAVAAAAAAARHHTAGGQEQQ